MTDAMADIIILLSTLAAFASIILLIDALRTRKRALRQIKANEDAAKRKQQFYDETYLRFVNNFLTVMKYEPMTMEEFQKAKTSELASLLNHAASRIEWLQSSLNYNINELSKADAKLIELDKVIRDNGITKTNT